MSRTYHHLAPEVSAFIILGLQVNKTFKPNGTLDTHNETNSYYRGDGQIIYQTSTNMVTNDIQRTDYNDAGMIDAQGNQRSYRVEVTKGSGTGNYTNNYSTNYALFDTYKASTITVTTTQSGFTPGTTTNTYTERGELMQAAATGTAGFTRQYASNREGMVISRRESSGKAQNYVYYQGGVVASVGNAAVAELSSTLTPIWQNEYEASRPNSCAVGQGDTLSRIAQMVWGDSRMWYLIADANGLSQGANDVLQAGDNLKIPSVVTSTQNNATTFKPYNPTEIIGDNTPSPNPPPPPPPPKKKCGGLATIIMVVVAAIAVVVTAGAAAVALGAGGGLFAAGGAALAGGTLGTVSMGFGTALAASVIGGAVGSAVSQLAGMALGVVDKFSWRQVASGGLTAGALAGLGGFLGAAQPGSWAETAANALRQKDIVGYSLKGVFSYGTSQAANRVAGLSTSFSWRDLAATAVGSAAAGSIGESSAFSGLGDFTRATITGQLSAFASAKIKDQWFGGGPINYGQVAADAFGNALGNYAVGQMEPKAAVPANPYAKANERWGAGYYADLDGSNTLSDVSRLEMIGRASLAADYIETGTVIEITYGPDGWDPVDDLGPEYQFDNMLAEQRVAGSSQSNDIWSEVGATIGNGFAQLVGNAFSNTVNGVADWVERFVHAQPGDYGRLQPWVQSRNEVADSVARDFAAVTAGIAPWAPVAKFSRASSAVTNRIPVSTAINTSVRLVDQESLSPGLRRTFMDGQYATVETISSVMLFRKFGGTGNQAKANGAFATTTTNASRSETAVFQKWSNQRFEAQIEVPERSLLNIGKVAPQMSRSGARVYHQGGADQILLPKNYPDTWIKSVRDGKTGTVYNLDQFRKSFPDQFN